MEAKYPSETSVDFQRSTWYYNHNCHNLSSYIFSVVSLLSPMFLAWNKGEISSRNVGWLKRTTRCYNHSFHQLIFYTFCFKLTFVFVSCLRWRQNIFPKRWLTFQELKAVIFHTLHIPLIPERFKSKVSTKIYFPPQPRFTKPLVTFLKYWFYRKAPCREQCCLLTWGD
jgi:hypothetical protein